ncbi:MAG: hypothetical protein A2X94_03465 [Bdellovibrionales bacterium GWB1_55_8]|nr:MAG: hypothetical protein A2X94_03465 [Bdellovibrionales bacterium GWB1_55_8]
MNCRLCLSSNIRRTSETIQGQRYFACGACDLRFLAPEYHLSSEAEKAHYLKHNNDVNDPRYREFVKPLCDAVRSHSQPGASGLDFGAGTGPVLSEMLESDGYLVTRYDPYFHPDPVALERSYDFVCSCEVVEHFNVAASEFARLRRLLNPGGLLAISTVLHGPGCDFENWYYRLDPTHVAFYSERTFKWISDSFGFSKVQVMNNRIVLLWT